MPIPSSAFLRCFFAIVSPGSGRQFNICRFFVHTSGQEPNFLTNRHRRGKNPRSFRANFILSGHNGSKYHQVIKCTHIVTVYKLFRSHSLTKVLQSGQFLIKSLINYNSGSNNLAKYSGEPEHKREYRPECLP
jgi:hypothetical protein